MKVAVMIFCLVGAVFANPILYKVVLEPSGLEANVTLSSSVPQSSSESDTSELQSSENTSTESSESESSESISEEDKTSEESDSESLEDRTSSMEETRDNSMASEENMRKSVFVNVVRVLSAEDNSSSSTEATVTGHPDLSVTDSPTSSQSNETSQESQSSQTQSTSSESSESSETSEVSDSRDSSSESSESDASDSVEQVKAKCQQSDSESNSADCESEEGVFQDIGDDALSPMGHLAMPDNEEHREFSLRR